MTLALLGAPALFTGCSTTTTLDEPQSAPIVLSLESDRFGERPDIASPDSIHELSAAQREVFLAYFGHPKNQDRPPHKRVLDYLELETRQFNYLGETYTASQALEESAGNCLSLAILTTSLAQAAGVDIDYQLIDSQPVYSAGNNHIRRSIHIRSVLYDPNWFDPRGFWTLMRPRVKVDYFPGKLDRVVRRIDMPEYVSLYYQNLAADALDEDDLDRAYWLLMESLEFTPHNAESLNALAIVFYRAGDKQKSEEIYRYGIDHARRRVSLLRNYGIFLKKQGRLAEAQKISKRLLALEDPNPFDWIYAAQQAYRDGEYRRAVGLFSKSAALAPYLHESQFGLAKTYFAMGNTDRARHALEQAMDLAAQPSTRDLYRAKMSALAPDRNLGND